MRRALWAGILLAVLGLVTLLYASVPRMELTGDDYQWLGLEHRTHASPSLLLADLDGFWRPTATWTLRLEELAAPHSAAFHHGANLAFHLLAVVLLALAARRLSPGLGAAAAVALLWGVSPFATEPVVSVASRHQTLLLSAWLVMILAWPARQQTWSRWRAAAVCGAILFAAASKETWVVTPGLVLVLELAVHGSRPRRALLVTAASAGAAAVYLGLHLLLLPGGRDYFAASPAALAKVPHELAAFFELETLVPIAFRLSLMGILAAAATAVAVAAGLRLRLPGAAVGTALLLLPTVPTLLVPYLPTRYTAIPYAGFLLLLCTLAGEGLRRMDGRRRWLAAAPATVLAALVALSSFVTVRADLDDYGRLSDLHARLLAEAARVAPELPVGVPVILVRLERDNPLRELALSPRGLPKIYYPRPGDPYGLIDSAALFDWILRPEGLRVNELAAVPPRAEGGAVLAHRGGGFGWSLFQV